MNLTIEQEATYERDNWWKWSVWIEGDKADLAKIKFVEYTLHPTFPTPIREVTDRRSKFRLDSAGWGEFKIGARLQMKDGRTRKLSRWLELKYPSPESARAGARAPAKEMKPLDKRPMVFVSCNISDVAFANALSQALLATNIDVATQAEGLPWEASMNLILDQVDSGVFVVSDTPSTWMKREIDACLQRKIPLIPVVLMSSKIKLEEWHLNSTRTIPIKPVSPENISDSAREVARRIHEDLKSNLKRVPRRRAK